MQTLLQKSAALPHFFRRLTDNPIIIKELRGRMRGRRAFVVLIVYLLIVSLLTAGIYQTLIMRADGRSSTNTDFRQNMGKAVFGSVIGFELLLIGFIGPALTAGAITGERERQTLDLLRTTLISSRTLVLGKLASSCAFLLLLVLAAIPIEALAFILGGVGLEELFVSSLLLLVNIFFFCALGILCSSFSKRTLTATIASYSIILVSLIATALIFYGFIQYGDKVYRYDTPERDLLNITIWYFCATNTPLTAYISQFFLMEEHVFIYGLSPFGKNIYLFSPWVLHVPLAAIISSIMVLVSILRVNKPEH